MLATIKMRDSIAVITVNSTRLDASNSGGLKEELKPIVATHKRIVLDLSRVEFVDSSGLGAILSALRQANSIGGDIKLANLARPVRVVVELTRMHRIFEIFESADSAVHSFDDGSDRGNDQLIGGAGSGTRP